MTSSAITFKEFVQDYFAIIIVALMILIFAIIVLIAAKKRKSPKTYVSDEIDRTVDAAAKEKAAKKAEEAPEVQSTENQEEAEPQTEQEPQAEQEPQTQSVEEAMQTEDEQEELTFEAEDVEEAEQKSEREQKDTPSPKRRTVSYRILYDRETRTWEVRKDNAKRVIRRVRTKKEALVIAQELSQKQDLNLVVHKKDGKFQKKR